SGSRFFKLNCAALPGDVLENELFGYRSLPENGWSRLSKFELCKRGTLFLDEITEMPSSLQLKLLTVLQDGRFIKTDGQSREEMEQFGEPHLLMGEDGVAPEPDGTAAEDLRQLPGNGIPGTDASPHESAPSGLKSLLQSVKGETERNAISTELEQTRWNRKAAARLLKVSYRTLLYKIQQYHMSPPDYIPPVGTGLIKNGQIR